jgi:hypothetical protein
VLHDEPGWLDNPYRREAHRPRYARRSARWLVGLAIVTLIGLNVDAFMIVGTRTDPITVDAAVARYRAAAARPTSTTTTAAVADASAAAVADDGPAAVPAALAAANPPADAADGTDDNHAPVAVADAGAGGGSAPAPGVYVFATSGWEEVSVLGGARHDYPSQSTLTLTKTGCGYDIEWAPLVQRSDLWSTCLQGKAISVSKYVTHHEFFGQTEDRSFDCQALFLRPPDETPGSVTNGTCVDGADHATTATTVVGPDVLTIAGQPVEAVHLQLEQDLTGSTNGYRHNEVWLRESDGMLLRMDAVTDADGASSIGQTHYHEELHILLSDPNPQQ